MSATGLDNVLKRLGAYEQAIVDEARNIVQRTAVSIHGDAVKSIQRGRKSGRIYLKTQAGIPHQASAPGEAPATDTGALVSSLQLKGAGTSTMYVYTNLKYAPFLEFGTSRLAPRPFMRPALQSNRPKFERAMQDLLKTVKAKLR